MLRLTYCNIIVLQIIGEWCKIKEKQMKDNRKTVNNMESLPKYYLALFSILSDVMEEIDAHNYGRAKELIMKAQAEAEELYLNQSEQYF